LKSIAKKIRRTLPLALVFVMLGGPVVITMTSCQPKVCPANNKQQFNRKRARYSMINHMNRRGGKGQKKRKTKHRRPEFGFFKTRLKRSQFKQHTK